MSVVDVVRASKNRPREELELACRTLQAELRGRPSPGLLRPLLIGQAPGPRTHKDLALFPEPRASAGGRLFEMTGLSVSEYMRTFDRVNVLYQHWGKAPAGTEDRFPAALGRAAAEGMRHFLAGREVLLVGRDVATAFGHEAAPWLEWRDDFEWSFRFAILPHPSGRNHWYSDEANRRDASRFLRAWSQKCVAFCPRAARDSAPPTNPD